MGTVCKTFQQENTEDDSDSDDDDDSDGDDDDDSDDSDCGGFLDERHRSRAKELQHGEVVVQWDDGLKRVHRTCDLALVDRSFLHGNIVGRKSHYFASHNSDSSNSNDGGCDTAPSRQCGTVIGVDLVADVEYEDTKRDSRDPGKDRQEGETRTVYVGWID